MHYWMKINPMNRYLGLRTITKLYCGRPSTDAVAHGHVS